MDRLSVEALPTTQAGVLQSSNLASRVLLSFALAQFAFVCSSPWWEFAAAPEHWWLGELLLLLLTASTLCSLSRQLPWQNVLLTTVLIPLLAAALEIVGIPTGISFGLNDARRSLSIHQAWLAAQVWIVVILNCRGVGRLSMRRWRMVPGYGFWLLGITLLLLAGVMLNIARSSSLLPGFSAVFFRIQLDWHAAGTFVGTVGTSAIILVAITAALINKKPEIEIVNWHPLVLWSLFNLCFFAKAVEQRALFASAMILLEILLVIVFIRMPLQRTRKIPRLLSPLRKNTVC
ncbi:MAG TPA: hypothetical protein VL361_12625 [Candidatus Limnocylindrales bacterium]|nr:hypothetical protein [Candidatus Limnocylindrales bacterium]